MVDDARCDRSVSVGWSEDGTDPVDSTTAELLHDYRDRTAAEEVRAERDRPADPSANWSGWWWSTPPPRCSSQPLFDGTPAGLWFVEDSMGWERAVTRRMNIPASARVYEVDGAQAWAELCRQFSVEVTAQKRHDWYRTTGRSGRWVFPDWPRLSERYEGVHLTVAGYLAAAGTAITVDADTAITVDADTASVIAGWRPTIPTGSPTPSTSTATTPEPGCATPVEDILPGSKKRTAEDCWPLCRKRIRERDAGGQAARDTQSGMIGGMPVLMRLGWVALASLSAAVSADWALGPMLWTTECQLGEFPTELIASWDKCTSSTRR